MGVLESFGEVTMHCHGYAGAASRTQWAKGLFLALVVALLAAQSVLAAPAPRTVLVFGDSLSAGYGMAAEQGWVALLGERLAQRKPAWKVVNASVSGETTAGGGSRIAKVLERHDPDVVVIELGANDGLRGLPLAASRANLERMVRAARDSGAKVLLVGMRMPPNLGRAYTEGFEANFREVAKDEGVALLPFLLEPIASDPDAFQADDLHPTAAVQPRLLEHVWTALEPLL